MATEPDIGSSLGLENLSEEDTETLAWARDFYGVDFSDPKSRAAGIRDIQNQLVKSGIKLDAAGILGPRTLDALRQQHAAIQSPPQEQAPSEGSTDEAHDLGEQPKKADPGQETEPPTDAGVKTAALSDQAIETRGQDALKFGPRAEAVARFLLARETKPPLAIAINAPWGRGKTSFMKLIAADLESAAETAPVRIATTTFNPWKYGEAAQVWAAFIANVTRCIRQNLTPGQELQFRS